MVWHARLDLDYRLESGRCVARHTHSGPLRILQSLYPEGDTICHNVLVHPPGGLVGGDTLDLAVHAHAGSHALITTPGATRFYRSDGPLALQQTQLMLDTDARLEWLPQEAICYNACHAENRLSMQLAAGAEILGWDVTALGLPQAGQPFVQGHFWQHLEVPGIWLERGKISADDVRLMDSPAGLAGQRCLASLFFVAGSRLNRPRKERALECARSVLTGHPLAGTAGVTSPNPHTLVLRVAAPLVEPAMGLLKAVRAAWRQELWALEASSPRIWSM